MTSDVTVLGRDDGDAAASKVGGTAESASRLFGSPDQAIRPAPANADCHPISGMSDRPAVVAPLAQRPLRASRMGPGEQFPRREGMPRQSAECAPYGLLNVTDTGFHGGKWSVLARITCPTPGNYRAPRYGRGILFVGL